MKRSLLTLALVIVAYSHAAVAQTTLHVPSEYPTITGAVSAASEGDTVLVQPGTYFERPAIGPTNVVLLSAADDPSETVIHGGVEVGGRVLTALQ